MLHEPFTILFVAVDVAVRQQKLSSAIVCAGEHRPETLIMVEGTLRLGSLKDARVKVRHPQFCCEPDHQHRQHGQPVHVAIQFKIHSECSKATTKIVP